MKLLPLISKILIFIIGLALIIINHKTIGWLNILGMIVGLLMLLYLLYSYNKKFE